MEEVLKMTIKGLKPSPFSISEDLRDHIETSKEVLQIYLDMLNITKQNQIDKKIGDLIFEIIEAKTNESEHRNIALNADSDDEGSNDGRELYEDYHLIVTDLERLLSIAELA